MKNNLSLRILLIAGSFLFSTCKKEHIEFQYKDGASIKYSIVLSGNEITSYQKFTSHALQEIVTFTDSANMIVKITKDCCGGIKAKSYYYLGEDGYAASSVDTTFSSNGLFSMTCFYEYTDDFLSKCTVDWKNYGSYPDSGQYSANFLVEDENIISSTISFGCSNYYSFNQYVNKINLKFMNSITGRHSKNLLSHTILNSGCPTGPSSTTAYGDYEYELDNDGKVIRMLEINTPSYHQGEGTQSVIRTVTSTTYEYL